MIISKTAKVIWNSRNKQHYVDLGYTFTKMGSPFIVKIKDLTKGSQALIFVKCDYCGKIYVTMWDTYRRLKEKDVVLKDCCGNPECTGKKSEEVMLYKYNVKNCRSIEEVNNKIKETCLAKYGVDNPFANEQVKEKIIQTNLKKYGCEYANQNNEINLKKSKSMKNYFEKYPEARKIKELSPCWKGGVMHSRVERATNEYIVWRKSVFSRDRYKCQCCGDKNGNGHKVKLCAHHIKNWKDNIEDRYIVNNGITLCESCHNKFHSLYGKRNNTLEQLQEFLNR